VERPMKPIRKRREALGLDRSELAEKAGMRVEDLVLVESGGHIVLSLPLATKLSHVLDGATPQVLSEDYRRWRKGLTVEGDE